MQKIVKENQNSIETLPWWCIEYEWREDKGCPRSHLSRPETSTWNLSFLYLPDIPQLFVCRHMHNSVLTKRCKPIYITQKITMCRNTQWVFKLTHRASKYILSVLLQAECVITRFDIDKLTLSAWFILPVANFFYMLWCMWQISGMVRTTQLSCPNFE